MKLDILLGLQWGDEGKGKIVDFLSPNYKIVARFQGGPNAGHTLIFNNKKFVLHLIPSGIFRPQTINVIGNGVVFDPVIFQEEVKSISNFADVKKNLIISNKANLILPTHRLLDAASEKAKAEKKIGSTLKGIAPAYTDKVGRNGLRIGDIFENNFQSKLNSIIDNHKKILDFYNFEYNDKEIEKWLDSIEELKKYNIKSTEYYLNDQLDKGNSILAEGAQGTMLDIEFGTYPFVTSSNTISAGANTGLGISPLRTGKIFGIFKAYTTRVGSGPFPTELFDQYGKELQSKGNEFGATTGRPRRCGWLDLVILNYACTINGVTDLIMTKADVLCGFKELYVAEKYVINDQEMNELPFNLCNDNIKPKYTKMNSWKEQINGVNTFTDLPENLKKYISFIENYLKTKISIISTGADRNDIIVK